MTHLLRQSALAAVLLAILALTSDAHGSIFQPPKDDDSPGAGWKGPGDVFGAPHGTPPGDVRAPTGPRPGSDGNGAGGVGALPGPGGPTSAATSILADQLQMVDWTWWWEFNKEPFLELRRHLRTAASVTGSDGFYLGRGEQRPIVAGDERLDPVLIRSTVVPAFLEALAGDPSTDVVTGCLVALAKIGNDFGSDLRRDVAAVLRSHLRSSTQEVSETAAVALGILARPDSALVLADIAEDVAGGRRAVGKRRVPARTRAFAAYGLGLIGHRAQSEDVRRFIVHKLARILAADDTKSRDLAVACVLSLGRVPLDWSTGEALPESRRPLVATSRETQVTALLAILRDARADHIVRAHAATSLATVLAGDASASPPALLDEVKGELCARLGGGSREPREVRQSAAIGLGLLGDADDDPADAKIRATLLGALGDERDATVRHFTRIALARVGARTGKGPDREATDRIRSRLLRDLSRGATTTRRWTALALGIHERFRAPGGAVAPASADALRASLAGAASPIDRGAFAVANGILGDVEAEPLLRRVVDRRGEDWVRGLGAVALGLVDARGSLDALREMVPTATFHPDFLRELAIGLGLLGDREVSALLVTALGETRSLASQASLARALGRIGGPEAIDPLISLLGSTEEVDLARAFAAVALGEVADEDALPWNTVFSIDMNYLAAPTTLFDLQGTGLLNIL